MLTPWSWVTSWPHPSCFALQWAFCFPCALLALLSSETLLTAKNTARGESASFQLQYSLISQHNTYSVFYGRKAEASHAKRVGVQLSCMVLLSARPRDSEKHALFGSWTNKVKKSSQNKHFVGFRNVPILEYLRLIAHLRFHFSSYLMAQMNQRFDICIWQELSDFLINIPMSTNSASGKLRINVTSLSSEEGSQKLFTTYLTRIHCSAKVVQKFLK